MEPERSSKMSKALVIKGANYAANKVETITLTQVVPCTGISIAPSTVVFDTLGATQQLTPTLTPADTTDIVHYVSSNEDVVTVSDSGLITCVGVGYTTITVTCGAQSATCAVESEISMTLSDYSDGYQFSSTDLSYNPPKNYAGLYGYANRGRVYASTTPTVGGYKAFSVDSSAPSSVYYPIMMPKNTATVEITMGAQCSIPGQIYVFDSTKEQTYLTGNYSNKPVALVTQYTFNVSCVEKKYTFQITGDGDSFAIQVANNDITQIPGSATAVFKGPAN